MILIRSRLIRFARIVDQKLVWFYNWTFAWALLFWFPYGTHGIRATIRLGYYLSLALLTIGLPFHIAGTLPPELTATISTHIQDAWTLIRSDPIYAALTFCAWYLLAAITYHPKDKKEYRANTQASNKTAEFLKLSYALILSIVPMGFFTLIYYLNAPGLLAFGAVAVAAVMAGRRWLDTIAPIFTKSANRTRSSFYRDARNSIYIPLTGLLIVLAAIALVFGTLAVFLFHLIWMLFVARRIRWVVYEDLYGFKNLSPSPIKWGLVARVPLMYAVVVVAFDQGFVMESAVFASFAPFVVGLSYVAYRHAALNGFEAKPYGKYEQMDEKETRYHQMNAGWIALTGGRKAPSDEERFQTKVNSVNSRIRMFNNGHRDHVVRQHGVRLPCLRMVTTDVDEFDLQTELDKFAAYRERLQDLRGLPFHEANDIARRVDDIESDLRDAAKFHAMWIEPYKNWEPPVKYF